ncbi:hypothetical protein HDU86_001096 [Geranomyces michiganensis]|nr:hypothetical protein HDU86_001096 [Geranomyces michiganensis]
MARMRIDGVGAPSSERDLRRSSETGDYYAVPHADVHLPTASDAIRRVKLDPASPLEAQQPRNLERPTYAGAFSIEQEEWLDTCTPEPQQRLISIINAIKLEELRDRVIAVSQLPNFRPETIPGVCILVVHYLPRGPYRALKKSLHAAGVNLKRILNMTWLGTALEVLAEESYGDELAGIFTMLGAEVEPDSELYAPEQRGDGVRIKNEIKV